MTDEHHVAGIILAAGLSQRYRQGNKLLAEVSGVPVVVRTVQAYCEAGLDLVVVVVGYEGAAVERALAGLPIQVVRNPAFEEGQSTSLRYGVNSLPAEASAAVIGVADQPLLKPGVIRQLVSVHRSRRAPVVVPRYAGQRGNPVLFDRGLFQELLEIVGDQGGRAVLAKHGADVVWVDVEDAMAGMDLDTVEDLHRLEQV